MLSEDDILTSDCNEDEASIEVGGYAHSVGGGKVELPNLAICHNEDAELLAWSNMGVVGS